MFCWTEVMTLKFKNVQLSIDSVLFLLSILHDSKVPNSPTCDIWQRTYLRIIHLHMWTHCVPSPVFIHSCSHSNSNLNDCRYHFRWLLGKASVSQNKGFLSAPIEWGITKGINKLLFHHYTSQGNHCSIAWEENQVICVHLRFIYLNLQNAVNLWLMK